MNPSAFHQTAIRSSPPQPQLESHPVMNSGSYRCAYHPLRTAPEGSFSSFAVDGSLTSSWPDKVAGLVVASAFDEPIVLKTGLRLGASVLVVVVEVESLMGWISLLVEVLGLRLPPVSLVSCFISLRRCGG
jgi:hypothetical protein